MTALGAVRDALLVFAVAGLVAVRLGDRMRSPMWIDAVRAYAIVGLGLLCTGFVLVLAGATP